jgi:hypothetical protein
MIAIGDKIIPGGIGKPIAPISKESDNDNEYITANLVFSRNDVELEKLYIFVYRREFNGWDNKYLVTFTDADVLTTGINTKVADMNYNDNTITLQNFIDDIEFYSPVYLYPINLPE